jgi:hypothetical protein
MSTFGNVQQGLNKLQIIPVVGPVVFSPIKAAVSKVQIISGVALGVLRGMAAIAAKLTGDSYLASRLCSLSARDFKLAAKGCGSLFYALVNMGTFGLVGLLTELERASIHYGHGYRFLLSRPEYIFSDY